MRWDESRREPTRGVIIVDSSVLLKMCVKIPPQFLANTHSRINESSPAAVKLADMLTFLAKNGYEVLIPEMVARECGGFLRTGQTAPEFLNQDANGNNNPFYLLTRDFFHSIPRNAGNIRITPPANDDTGEAAKYAQETWKIINCQKAGEEKLQRLALVNHAYSGKKNLGDDAAITLAAHLPVIQHEGKPVPMFYLCQDSGAIRRMAHLSSHDTPINELNLEGLYNAIQDRGFLENIGLKQDTSYKTIAPVIAQALNAVLSGTKESVPKEAIDSPINQYYANGSTPFYDSLEGLSPQPSRLQRFVARYSPSITLRG